MEQQEFWSRLEVRVTAEIEELKEDGFRGWWCDRFTPHRIGLVGERQAVIGKVWMGKGEAQEQWHFALLLIQIVTNLEEIHWEELLPAREMTGWLSLNAKKKEMKIEPATAYPDLTAESLGSNQ
ncbi:MAG TPA: hypothetical protein VGG19_20595 [Tepidisphaeraceae bacterium]|jgi:hypothetical protein